jgi:hypothetical protein
MTTGTGILHHHVRPGGQRELHACPAGTADDYRAEGQPDDHRHPGGAADGDIHTTFTVAATASSGLPVTVGASGACSLSGATVTMTSGTGTCTVTFSQAGNPNYVAAPQVAPTTTAQKASQAITVTQGAPATAAANTSFPVAATRVVGVASHDRRLGRLLDQRRHR